MTESVETRFSTFVHPKIWVAGRDNPPALERRGHDKRHHLVAPAPPVNRFVPRWDDREAVGKSAIGSTEGFRSWRLPNGDWLPVPRGSGGDGVSGWRGMPD